MDVRFTISNRRGFSFAELLFAVMILGVGFIMLAAIFPVGLSQTKSNFEENVTAAIASEATETLRSIARNQFMYATPVYTMPDVSQFSNTNKVNPANSSSTAPTYRDLIKLSPGQSMSFGTVMSFRDKRLPSNQWQWDTISRNLTLSTDPRFAWTALYMRKTKYTNNHTADVYFNTTARNATGEYASFNFYDVATNNQTTKVKVEAEDIAQVIVIGMRINNRGEYDPFDSQPNPANNNYRPAFYQLEPKPVYVHIYPNLDDGSYVAKFVAVSVPTSPPNLHGFQKLNNDTTDASPAPDSPKMYAAVLDAIGPGAVVVISDDRITCPAAACGSMNGRIFRVGEKRTDLGTNIWQLIPGSDAVKDPGANGYFTNASSVSTSDIFDDINQIGATGFPPPLPPPGTVKKPKFPGVFDDQNSNSTAVGIDSFNPSAESGMATAYVIGKGYSRPNGNKLITPGNTSTGQTSQYEDEVQDISVYTTFVRIQP